MYRAGDPVNLKVFI